VLLSELSHREKQILDLLIEPCDGNQQIGQRLGMATRTVKAHMNRLFLRFGIRGGIKRVKLAVAYYRLKRSQP
jgi:DNA-binding CsgD family transcriptional regulator